MVNLGDSKIQNCVWALCSPSPSKDFETPHNKGNDMRFNPFSIPCFIIQTIRAILPYLQAKSKRLVGREWNLERYIVNHNAKPHSLSSNSKRYVTISSEDWSHLRFIEEQRSDVRITWKIGSPVASGFVLTAFAGCPRFEDDFYWAVRRLERFEFIPKVEAALIEPLQHMVVVRKLERWNLDNLPLLHFVFNAWMFAERIYNVREALAGIGVKIRKLKLEDVLVYDENGEIKIRFGGIQTRVLRSRAEASSLWNDSKNPAAFISIEEEDGIKRLYAKLLWARMMKAFHCRNLICT
jgi:hypothetical protein